MNTPAHIEVTINGEPHSLPAECTMYELLSRLGLTNPGSPQGDAPPGVAIAANNEVVPRTQWDTRRITHNDSILIIRATQGG